jgi:hypothetical protein
LRLLLPLPPPLQPLLLPPLLPPSTEVIVRVTAVAAAAAAWEEEEEAEAAGEVEDVVEVAPPSSLEEEKSPTARPTHFGIGKLGKEALLKNGRASTPLQLSLVGVPRMRNTWHRVPYSLEQAQNKGLPVSISTNTQAADHRS